jgi:hypothetical protein
MSVPTDDAKTSDGKPAAAETGTVTSEDAATEELSLEELKKVSGGSPHAVDWIKGAT